MANPSRHGEIWTDKEISTLKYLVGIKVSTKGIADRLGRTEDAIRSKAHEENISLKPKDK